MIKGRKQSKRFLDSTELRNQWQILRFVESRVDSAILHFACKILCFIFRNANVCESGDF